MIAAIIIIFSCCTLYGQISTQEEPVNFKLSIPALQKSENVQKVMPSLDLNKIEQEDKEDDANGIPPRFGIDKEYLTV